VAPFDGPPSREHLVDRHSGVYDAPLTSYGRKTESDPGLLPLSLNFGAQKSTLLNEKNSRNVVEPYGWFYFAALEVPELFGQTSIKLFIEKSKSSCISTRKVDFFYRTPIKCYLYVSCRLGVKREVVKD
jgi:hypothetical protein